jgi:hypothetical protein
VPLGHVGRVMLEDCAQIVGFTRLSAARRQLGRLTSGGQAALIEAPRGRPGRRAQATPRYPHLRTRRALAPRHASVSGFRSTILIPAYGLRLPKIAKPWTRPTGRGGRSEADQCAKRGAGRGNAAAAWGEALRRTGEASGRAARVN